MKKRKLFGFLCKKEQAMQVPVRVVVGITESDWVKTYNALVCEYNAAKLRQRRSDGKPSDYMRGLDFARKTLDSIRPYNISEVQQ